MVLVGYSDYKYTRYQVIVVSAHVLDGEEGKKILAAIADLRVAVICFLDVGEDKDLLNKIKGEASCSLAKGEDPDVLMLPMRALSKASAMVVKNVASERLLNQGVEWKLKSSARVVENDKVLTSKLYPYILHRMEELEAQEGLKRFNHEMRTFDKEMRKKDNGHSEGVSIEGELSKDNKMETKTMKEDECGEPNEKNLRMLQHFEE
ncbi:hypothetical protein AMTR_s00003p00264330 [Amborella trichopoda]|uniref:Uncharacterized protein n=1 Tax=Amborella trichopoda TaxID=13333 RepID=W1P0S0_AMBTC|nr:hypothetical protein AMTR_s00003p00264330 [Amborella trichopoda]